MKKTDNLVKKLEQAAKREAELALRGEQDPEPSLGSRLGQIGLLGWMIVTPTLFALWIGRKIDRLLETDITFSAASLLLGVSIGFWFAWRWMHKQ